MQKDTFVITLVSRDCISKQVYMDLEEKNLDLKRKWNLFKTITVTLYAAGILIFTVYKVKKLNS